MATTADTTAGVELPAAVSGEAGDPEWGSDVVADLLRALDIEYVALMPGASFRGVHDSLVNYTGNRRPRLVLCPHESDAVFMARGYARVTGRPMGVLLHNVVGLLNATMAIHDCWIDRVPALVMGGTGPVDASKRRPLIDWIHTANVQGNIVRDYTKWDDQPASLAAVPESLLRAYRIACQDPPGPVYVCLDSTLQEEKVDGFLLPDAARYAPAKAPEPPREDLARAAEALVAAELPVAFVDRLGRDPAAVRALVDLAEMLAMPVVDQAWLRASFPALHALEFTGYQSELLPHADVVIGLDCQDFGGAVGGLRDGTQSVSVTSSPLLHRGLVADYGPLPPVDVPILANAATTVPLLLEACRVLLDDEARERIERRRASLRAHREALRSRRSASLEAVWDRTQISEGRLATELWNVVRSIDFVVTMGNVHGYAAGVWEIGPERNLHGSASGAIGAALPTALGSALALKESGALPVALMGDGEFVMSCHALWTAARYRISSLIVVNNNRTYGNDEAHQTRIASIRGRPVENARVAMRMESPEPDVAGLARSFGARGIGPVKEASKLAAALAEGAAAAARGACVVVDVWTEFQERG